MKTLKMRKNGLILPYFLFHVTSIPIIYIISAHQYAHSIQESRTRLSVKIVRYSVTRALFRIWYWNWYQIVNTSLVCSSERRYLKINENVQQLSLVFTLFNLLIWKIIFSVSTLNIKAYLIWAFLLLLGFLNNFPLTE